jgi:hypothetical protein
VVKRKSFSVQVRGTINAARAWDAAERYLSLEEFGNVLRQPMYSPLINCSQWEVLLEQSTAVFSCTEQHVV